MLNLVWVSEDGVFAPSTACTLQAVAGSAGAFAPSMLLAVIALHTYLVIVWGYKIQKTALRCCLCIAWGLIIVIPLLGLAISRNGEDHGGWYVRGDTWCSANSLYERLRFWVEFMPVIICLITTIVLYCWIGLSMFRNKCSGRHLPTPSVTSDSRRELSGHHPAFFVYPLIYLFTMGPLGICRLLIMAGRELDPVYYFVGASIIAAQGFLNCLLWTTTILFLSREEIEKIGLDHFMRPPDDRVFGNIVYIQGGSRADEPRDLSQSKRSHRGFVRMASVLGDDGRDETGRGRMQRSSSQMSLRHNSAQPQGGIQMETITTIIVEDGKPASRSRE
ncbi:uncharacterized protein B0I36DRAFT_330840 [Microdochium trichocladiopsis]|uniref:Glucose receptor Git3 N-terminal domain-containing protein n=1 Tax=Microdochium trichocladiopsis TaxID=1682393 RepID=A0A9P9BMR3_9PEZI|nr:uncharacterized protein B0I36DRAFT_330840 [Microdochium trichocladiopsis]KAH7026533.1 hypothetical protein B0I36DRAFT_330840 [Microdochium trichocladiopsis]